MEPKGRIQFYLPPTVKDAMRLKAEFGETVDFIAGGTDLVLKVRKGLKKPQGLIQLPTEKGEVCRIEKDRIRISALATLSQLIQSLPLNVHLPTVVQALTRIGSPQVRNVSTLGGNLVNACPACDSAPPLMVFDAIVVLENPRTFRRMPIERFFSGPGKTEVAADELLTTVEMTLPQPGDYSAFHKFGPRSANVIASANLAVRIHFDGEAITHVRLAAGSVAPTPVRLRNVEAALTGLTREQLMQGPVRLDVLRLLNKDILPISDVRGSRWYKHKVVELALAKTLEDVARSV